jgi:phospholipid-binding lipoprotein MlaA
MAPEPPVGGVPVEEAPSLSPTPDQTAPPPPAPPQPTAPAPPAGDGQADPAPPPPPAGANGAAPQPGDVVVQGRSRKGDPMAPLNAQSYAAAQAVDDAVVGPAARAYGKDAPKPIRKGLRNFLGNLREPVVAANYLLQLKPGKAGEMLGRFAINSTIGAAGLFDIAKRRPFNLPRRRNSFANTLGYYGVGPGPYFFLPLIGSTTVRDLAGNVLDQVIVPIAPVMPLRGAEFAIPVGVLSALDYRFEMDDEFRKQRASGDPYAASRRFYLERRKAEIDALRGRPTPVQPKRPR